MSESAEINFYEQVYAVTRAIPAGCVLNYGAIAALLNRPRAARAVGYALNQLRGGGDVPWYRVVGKSGEMGRISIKGSWAGADEQRHRLEEEGVEFNEHGQFPLAGYAWDVSPTEIRALLAEQDLL
jgi:methylated-DNA-protein-cysteine methyltransferase related protein